MRFFRLLALAFSILLCAALPARAVQLCNNAWMSTSTTGTGTITLGVALDGYQSFDDCGITNGQSVRYRIFDGTAWELGTGTYTTSGTTLTRTVLESSNSDSAISLSGSATVIITPLKQDIPSETTATDGTIDESAYLFALEAGVLSRYQLSSIEAALDLPDFAGTLTSGQLPAASATAQGACELATTTEAETGTDTTRCVTPEGLAAAIAASATVRSVNIQTFTADGTYTPSCTLVAADVQAVGGGGGGGGNVGSAGGATGASGGGGSGGYVRELFSAADIGASKTVTIGDAGTAGTSTVAPGGTGGTGGDTTLGTLFTAGGGTGGAATNANGSNQAVAGGAGGTATGGDVNVAGGTGMGGWHIDGVSGGSSMGGMGAASFFGGGGAGGLFGGTTGSAAVAYGAGGGGATSVGTTGRDGGAGAGGFMLITEYCE